MEVNEILKKFNQVEEDYKKRKEEGNGKTMPKPNLYKLLGSKAQYSKLSEEEKEKLDKILDIYLSVNRDYTELL